MTGDTPGDMRLRVGMGLNNVAHTTLRVCAQLGIEAVRMPARMNTRMLWRQIVPPAQTGPAGAQPMWDADLLRAIKSRIEGYGLAVEGMDLALSGRILMGQPGRDEDLDQIRRQLAIASELELRVLTYNFTALRASEGYGLKVGAGRGGTSYRDYDQACLDELPPLVSVGEHDLDAMWERYAYFVHAVMPEAERLGLRLAVHPNDPPMAVYRGVAQPLATADGLRRLLALDASSANALFFDTGVMTEIGEDAQALIREWEGRIACVHFRNVVVKEPHTRYVETFHDEGDADLAACMQALYETGYDGMIDPDHSPWLDDDATDMRIGLAQSLGGILALRNAVEAGWRRI